jgi:4-hydroxy-tetrahydrodipicolinate reductase
MKLTITGATGRMGQTLVRLVQENGGGFFVAATLSDKSSSEDVKSAFSKAEAVIDFSAPEASVVYAEQAASKGLIHIIGTTGFSPEQDEQIKKAASNAVIVKSGNMSLGVNLLRALVKKAAAKLGPEFDVEIVEMHHRNKADAPSGTALLLGKAAAEGRKINFAPVTERNGKRGQGIGLASLRGGSVTGEHQVIFAGPSERLILSHSAEDRAIFARGALKAALWAKGKKPGLYTMADVLGLNDN